MQSRALTSSSASLLTFIFLRLLLPAEPVEARAELDEARPDRVGVAGIGCYESKPGPPGFLAAVEAGVYELFCADQSVGASGPQTMSSAQILPPWPTSGARCKASISPAGGFGSPGRNGCRPRGDCRPFRRQPTPRRVARIGPHQDANGSVETASPGLATGGTHRVTGARRGWIRSWCQTHSAPETGRQQRRRQKSRRLSECRQLCRHEQNKGIFEDSCEATECLRAGRSGFGARVRSMGFRSSLRREPVGRPAPSPRRCRSGARFFRPCVLAES